MDTILCDELLEEVLRRLPPGSTFSLSTADVSLVSKRWLRLYRSSKSNLRLRVSPDNCTPPSLSSFLCHFPDLTALCITIDAGVGGGGNDVSNFPDEILLSVASSCPKLAGLRFRSEPVSPIPRLSLSTSCPRLTILYISLSRPFSFRWLVFLPSLETLGLLFNPVPCEVEHVEHVDADSKGNFDAELKLKTLNLFGIRRGDYGFDWLWKSCKNLKKLQLYRCDGIGDDTSASSINNCFKGLQEVELRRCGSIVNDILSRLVENCTSLSSLLIYDEGSSEGLLQFITHSRCNLQKLDLRLPLDLENHHLLAVAEKFRGLSSLSLDSCFLVTDEGLKTMALAMSNKVQELALVNCNVETGFVTTSGHSFRILRTLNLSYNEMLVDKEFKLILASCNCLRRLKVRGCKGLTNASIFSMFNSCKRLESVDIMNCCQIEAEAVELFVVNCRGLRQIYVEESKLSDISRMWASNKFIDVIVC